MSPLWGFGYLVHAVCYKHAAPLGLKAPTHQNSKHGIHRRGEVSSPDGLGNPTPTVSTVRWCLGILIRVLRPIRLIRDSDKWYMSPSGALVIWVYAACYIYAAPLGLKAPVHQNSRHGIHRRGLVSKPDGLGNPTPTHPISLPAFNPVHPLILSILI